MTSSNLYYEYKIRSGDTFSGIIHYMFGYTQGATRYAETAQYLLALNPHIKNPDFIRKGDMLRLGVLPPVSQLTTAKPIIPPRFIAEHVHNDDMQNFSVLAWMEHNANFLTIPGGIAMGAAGNLLSPGNVSLINKVSDHYADYKSGNITKGQYDSRRKASLNRLKQNIGPFEKMIFGKQTTHESIRIARISGIPATAHIERHAGRLQRMAALSRHGGLVLMGVGLTAACMKIANAADTKEKNEVFVETIASAAAGVVLGSAIGLFLVSNPIGWGTAIVLAIGSTTISYGAGKGATLAYDKYGSQVDFVSGTGTDKICQ